MLSKKAVQDLVSDMRLAIEEGILVITVPNKPSRIIRKGFNLENELTEYFEHEDLLLTQSAKSELNKLSNYLNSDIERYQKKELLGGTFNNELDDIAKSPKVVGKIDLD